MLSKRHSSYLHFSHLKSTKNINTNYNSDPNQRHKTNLILNYSICLDSGAQRLSVRVLSLENVLKCFLQAQQQQLYSCQDLNVYVRVELLGAAPNSASYARHRHMAKTRSIRNCEAPIYDEVVTFSLSLSLSVFFYSNNNYYKL